MNKRERSMKNHPSHNQPNSSLIENLRFLNGQMDWNTENIDELTDVVAKVLTKLNVSKDDLDVLRDYVDDLDESTSDLYRSLDQRLSIIETAVNFLAGAKTEEYVATDSDTLDKVLDVIVDLNASTDNKWTKEYTKGYKDALSELYQMIRVLRK